MRNRFSLSLATLLLTSVALGQAGPGVSKPLHKSPDLTSGPGGKIPASAVDEITLFRMRDPKNKTWIDRPGIWTAVLTVRGLPTKWGGKGSTDSFLGKFDSQNHTFTPSTHAAKLNIFGNDSSFQLDPTGLYAVIDRDDAFYFASRTATNTAFGTPVPIQGRIGSFIKSFEAPALGWVGGKLKLFWGESGIFMADLDITNLAKPKVSPKTTWVKLTGPKQNVSIPVPITGPDGDTEGMIVTYFPGGFNADIAFMEDLNPQTNLHTVIDNKLYLDTGAIMGGLILTANRNSTTVVQQVEASWLLGDVEKVGGTLDLMAGTPKKGKGAVLTAVFASFSTIKAAPITGFFGALGIAPAGIFPLVNLLHVDASEMAQISVPIPNLPGLKGLKLPIQGVSIDSILNTRAFTNTAWIILQ
jgi:hypothetical protein